MKKIKNQVGNNLTPNLIFIFIFTFCFCKFNKMIKTLTNIDLLYLAESLNIKNFRGVFMKNVLPNSRNEMESGIINLGNGDQIGTRWTPYYVVKNFKYYFDSWLPSSNRNRKLFGISTIIIQ